jgi:hypothetical protein
MRAIDADPKNRYEAADLFAEALEESFASTAAGEPAQSLSSAAVSVARDATATYGTDSAQRGAANESQRPSSMPPPLTNESQRPSAAPPPLNGSQRPSAAPPPLTNESRRPSSIPPARGGEERRSAPPPADPFVGAIDEETGGFGGTLSIPRPSRIPLPIPPSERGADLGVAEAIERTADAAVSEGNLERAENVLRAGLELGQAWLVAGEREAAGAAVRVFGRKLGVVLRRLGHLEESEDALKTALEYADVKIAGGREFSSSSSPRS